MINSNKMPSLKDCLSMPSIATVLVFGSVLAFCLIEGITESIPGWKLKNYYQRALTFYADTSGNGRIESEEQEKFIQDFVADIRQKPDYENFSLRAADILEYKTDARRVLSLLRQYRPVSPFQ